MKIALEVKGGKELARALRGLSQAASEKIVVGALRKGGEYMAATIASLMKRGPEAPHAADNVRVSVARRVEVDGITRSVMPDEYAVSVGPTKDFYYWYFREYGTVYQPAAPAMRPGFDQSVDRSLDIVIAILREAIAAQARAGKSDPGVVAVGSIS